MAGVDDIIRQWVEKIERSGELRGGPSWGKPFEFSDGYLDTPDELRMTYKILRNAGYVPAEVEMLARLAALREQLGAPELAAGEARALSQEVAELEQRIAILLDKFRRRR